MKLAWPIPRLSRWSRRLLQRITFALAACILAISLAVPSMAIAPSSTPTSGLTDLTEIETTAPRVAQAQTNVLVFNTFNYAVRVFTPAGSVTPVMNVFRRTAPSRLELNAQPAVFRGAVGADGYVSYDSFGSRDGINVIFRSSYNRSISQARLEIIDQANNSVLVSESASNVAAPAVPAPQPGPSPTERNTLLGFETQNYAIRVFREDGIRKLNVYHKPTGQTLVNGQPATADLVGLDASECWITYYGGQQYNGVAARYYVQVNAAGNARLEVIDVNGSVLLAEPRLSAVPLITNVPPEDRPACIDTGVISSGAPLARYVAAVFGGETTLQQVNQALTPGFGSRAPGGLTCVLDPRFENAPQGRFINAAECDGRNDAEAVVSFLRGRGINARLVYRNFRYR